MKECPRCHRKCLDEQKGLNAISHIGLNVQICSVCGKNQGLVGMGYCGDIVEIDMEERFKKEIKEQ